MKSEDVFHTLFNSGEVLRIWAQQFLGIFPSMMAGSKTDFVQCLQEQRSNEDLQKVLMIAWGFWKHMNRFIFKGQQTQPSEAISYALTLHADYIDYCTVIPRP